MITGAHTEAFTPLPSPEGTQQVLVKIFVRKCIGTNLDRILHILKKKPRVSNGFSQGAFP